VRVAEARALLARTSSRTGATGREPFVSVACHAPSDVVAAAREGADAAVLSPIFASPGKGAPLGPAALAEARRALDDAGFSHVHLVALGGIDASRAPSCFAAGAGGVAAIREGVVSTLATRLAT
jgi:thiamine-phosphate pyrophosphorylase